MPKTYTVKEVADILGFSTNSIYAFLKEKRIRGVRIGKGRFRIPEEELSRILHLSKKTASIAPVHASVPEEVRIVRSDDDALEALPQTGDAVFFQPASEHAYKNRNEISVPNIFDWFIGLGAIVAGVGLFLFNTTITGEEFPRLPLIYPYVRVILIACGLGVILSGTFERARNWRRVFYVLLAVMGFFNSFGLLRSGDIEGGALYGALAFMVAIAGFVPFGGIVTVGLYVSLIAFLVPAVMLVFPADSHVQTLSMTLDVPAAVIGTLSFIISSVLITGFWFGHARNRGLFLLSSWILAFGDIAVSLWYAHLQYWSRSFFILVVGAFTALLPYWWPLQMQLSRRYRLLLHGLFAGLGMVFVLAVLVVYLLQQSIWVSREREIMSKMHVGHTRLNNAVTSLEGSLVVAASNVDFVSSVRKPDISLLNKYSKIIYESNPNIRRLVFLDEDGKGVALYPYGTFDEPNYSFREYFQQTKSTAKPYVSEVFQARVDQAGRYVVTLSVPLFDKGTFVGVVSASMDLDRMGMLLDELAAAKQGEYFVVVDGKGVILSHPNEKLIGTMIPENDPLRRALNGEEGLVKGTMIEGMLGMMGYMYVPELRWAISLRVPATKVFGLSSVDIWVVFGVVCALVGAGITMLSYIRGRVITDKEGGP